jgi:cytochrome c-type biogenesis protein CcmF
VARNRRRYGGYIVHAGVVMMFVGFAGKAFAPEPSVVTLKTARDTTLMDSFGHAWRFESLGVSSSQEANRLEQSAPLNVWRDGKPMGTIHPQKRDYQDNQRNLLETSTEVALLYSARQDVYVVLSGFTGTVADPEVNLRISFFPLVMWIWIGGAVMAIGGLIVMWPQAERRRAQAGYAAPITATAPLEEALV